MYYSLNSLKGGYIGDDIGTTIGIIKGDTRSLDYGSYVPFTSPISCNQRPETTCFGKPCHKLYAPETSSSNWHDIS